MERRTSFLRGAFVLTVAGFIVKILGAVYRIPLAMMIKDEGMGLYQMAYPIYVTLLSISTAGLPTAISKLVSSNVALKRYKNAFRIFKVSLTILGIIGFVSTAVLIIYAPYLSVNVLGNPKAYFPLISIAPAIFFVSIMSSFRGFFQGLQDMTPSAISQVVEQIGRVATVFLLASLLLPKGVEYAAAGAAFGPVVGAVLGLLVLIAVYYSKQKEIKVKISEDLEKRLDNPIKIFRDLLIFAVPITLGGLIIPVMNLADAAIVPKRLQVAGFSITRATELYGQLTGMAAPLINLPAIVTISLSASLVPAISEAMALNNIKLASERAQLGVRIALMFAIPAAVGLFILATPVSILLYKNQEAGIPLSILAWGIIFLSLQQTTTGILQGVGKAAIPVYNLLLGALSKIIANFILTAIPAVNIRGAAFGTVLGYAVASLLNFAAAMRYSGMRLDFGKMIIRPGISALFMGAFVNYSFKLFLAKGVGQNLSTLFSIAIGVTIYILSLLLVGGIEESELLALPFGERLARIVKKINILRR